MEERILNIAHCDAGDFVYLSFQVLKGDDFTENSGRNWLIIDDGLFLDVTQRAGEDRTRVVVRVSSSEFPALTDLAPDDLNITLRNARGSLQFQPVLHRLSKAEALRGNIATVKNGAITGWVTDPEHLEAEIPVEAEINGETLLAMSSRIWVVGDFRAFDLPLPTDVPHGMPLWVHLRAQPGGKPFNRSPVVVTRTPQGWLLAAPVRIQNDHLLGDLVFALAPDEPATATIRFADGTEQSDACLRNSPYAFGGSPCGFCIEGVAPDQLIGARLQIAHRLLGPQILDFPLESFLTDPGNRF